MANLLTKETRTRRRMEYYVRIATLLAFELSVALALGALLLLPAYVYIDIITRAHKDIALTMPATDVGAERQAFTELLKKDQKILERAAEAIQVPNVHTALEKFFVDFGHREDFTLTSVQAHYAHEKHAYVITVAGEAMSREVIVSLRTMLEKASYLTMLEFPLTNFTPQEGGVYTTTFSFVVSD